MSPSDRAVFKLTNLRAKGLQIYGTNSTVFDITSNSNVVISSFDFQANVDEFQSDEAVIAICSNSQMALANGAISNQAAQSKPSIQCQTCALTKSNVQFGGTVVGC